MAATVEGVGGSALDVTGGSGGGRMGGGGGVGGVGGGGGSGLSRSPDPFKTKLHR